VKHAENRRLVELHSSEFAAASHVAMEGSGGVQVRFDDQGRLENLLAPEIGVAALAEIRILNFKEGVELRYAGSSRLVEHGPLLPA